MSTESINHVAIILDGNGRWATKQGLPRIKGHHKGVQRVKEIAIECSKRDVKRLTTYAFSTENWKRPVSEVNYIFKLPKEFLKLYLKDLMKHQIKIEYIGDLDNIPEFAKKTINDSMELTKNNKGMILCFALNYGFYDEMVRAVKKVSSLVVENKLAINDINEDIIANNLYDATPVDLLIRTSGEQRISNFMMWQIAYSEIYFTDILWPEFTINDLDKAFCSYFKRDRRFGGVKDAQ